MTSDAAVPLPPDQDQRDKILRELDRNMLVEAAAGTGKTTSMVGRMVALLREGKCEAGTLGAVTFTRKAAAELRGRFQIAIEKAARAAAGEEKERLERALEQVHRCFCGTIHSFCARLLRERPVEAGVDVAFEELEEEADGRLRAQAWEEHVVRLLVDDPAGLLAKVERMGVGLDDLGASFAGFAEYPDVTFEVPPATTREPAAAPVLAAIRRYLDHAETLVPRLPAEAGTCKVIPFLKRVHRIVSHYEDLGDVHQLRDLVGRFPGANPVQKWWKQDGAFTTQEAREEKERYAALRDEVLRPFEQAWLEYGYGVALRLFLGARERYDALRAERGVLNFQDLLMTSASMLKDQPHVRRYFSRRFTHLLVDEFQDTDPIQAEVMLLLTADDDAQSDWRRCVPRAGSLFVVGDPKQSIYRFRRADIVTYNEVKRIIAGAGGEVVQLSANFRTTRAVVDWANGVFEPLFPDEEQPESPVYVGLDVGRTDGNRGDLVGVHALTIPEELCKKELAIPHEADRIARTIRHALDAGLTVSRPQRDLDGGATPAVTPADFLIVTRTRKRLSEYARALQEYGIPHRVTGGSALNEVSELELLRDALRAVIRRDDPVALVGLLRGELFGISDAQLFGFKRAGGRFRYGGPVPDGLDEDTAAAFEDAFARLTRHARWLSTMPPLPAIERIAADLGLMVRAAGRPGGDVQAGSLAKAIEILRRIQVETWSATQLVAYLDELVAQTQKFDGVSARSEEVPVVRLMNLHKVKGLEAPVVFLADPFGHRKWPANLVVDRSTAACAGSMLVQGAADEHGNRPVLARPPGWDTLAGAEERFQEWEALRLRYVAATRAGSALIVTQKTQKNHTNPWKFFAGALDDELEDPGTQEAPVGVSVQVAPGDAGDAREAIRARVAAGPAPTHGASAAKAYALSRAAPEPVAQDGRPEPGPRLVRTPDGEHGVEWGSAIHLLLELAMQSPGADLERLARAALEEFEIAASHAPAALATVRAVMRSKVWRRAMASRRRLTEAPFVVLAADVDPDAPELPTLLRGTVDLAFEEDDGWVLVDYKTDRVDRPGDLERLVRHYAPQVRLYARAWRRCTGEPVSEVGLYFSRADRFVTLDDPRNE